MVIKTDIVLGDQVSAPAKSAASTVSALAKQVDVLTKALNGANDKMTKAQATGNIAAFRSAKTDVANLSATLGPLKQQYADATSGAREFNGAQAELAELTGGLSLVAEALGAVALGFGVVVAAGAKMAIEANEAKARMVSLFGALSNGRETGDEIVGMLDNLSDSIGQTREKLAPLTQEFLKMGIKGTSQLESLTRAAASAEAITTGGAQAFTKLFAQATAAAETGSKFAIPFKKLDAQLRASGLNIGDLAKEMGMTEAALASGLKAGTVDAGKFAKALQDAATSKGAGPLERAGASLTNVWEKFRENISKLFEDVDVGDFLAQVKSLFDIFGQAKPSGNALKAGIGAFFKEVFANATKVVPMVKHFLLDVIIYGLKAYIALKPIAAWFIGLSKNQTVMAILVAVFKGFGVILLVVAAAIGFVVGLVIACWAACALLIAGVYALIGSFLALTEGAGAALADWLKSIPGVAQGFIDGLVNGIKSGAAAVIGAVTGVVGGAIDAAKKKLGIASPSKVMMQLGAHTGGGFAEGVENAGPDVSSAGASLAGAVAGGAASGGGGGGGGATKGGGGSGATFNVVVNVAGGGKGWEEVTEEAFAIVLERVALQGGM